MCICYLETDLAYQLCAIDMVKLGEAIIAQELPPNNQLLTMLVTIYNYIYKFIWFCD